MTWQFDVLSAMIGFVACPLGGLLLLVMAVYWMLRRPSDLFSRSMEDDC